MTRGTCPVCGLTLNTYAKRATGEPTIGLHAAPSGAMCPGRGRPALSLTECERCHQPSTTLRRNRRLDLMTCQPCRAAAVRLLVSVWGTP